MPEDRPGKGRGTFIRRIDSVGNDDRGAQLIAGHAAIDNGRDHTDLAPVRRVNQSGEGLKVVAGREPLQQDAHRTVAAETEPPQVIVGAPHIVVNRPCTPVRQHFASSLDEITLEAAAAEQPDTLPVRIDEHSRAGLAVG